MSTNEPTIGGEETGSDYDPIIVAIDFGTTYSGVAWVRRSQNAKDPYRLPVIKRWPSRVAPQVRSEIEYDERGEVRRWGYLEGQTKRQHYRFNLLKSLLPIEGAENQRQNLEHIYGPNLPHSITIRSAVRDYMSSLLDYVIEQLRKEGVLPDEMMEFVITFPACWSRETQREYRKALSETRLKKFMDQSKVYYLKEPEAAMIGTLHAPHRRPPSLATDLSGGVAYKHVAILDAGGGTLDFSAYKVKTWDPFDVHEIRTAGKQIGGSNVDEAFWKYFTTSLQKKGVDTKKMHPRSRNAIIREFERLKCSFPDDPEYILPLPQDSQIPRDLDGANIEDGQLVLSIKTMTYLFDSIIDAEIIPFLDEQKKVVETRMSWKDTVLFLVGGFGGSSHLQDKIQKWAKTNQVKKLIVPQNSWTAVVCGAAKFGLCQSLNQMGPVSSRVSECSIGIVRDIRWERHRHSKGERMRGAGGKTVAKDQIEWLVEKGNQLENKEVQLQRTFKDWPSSWNETLVTSNKSPLPQRLNAEGVTPFGVIKVVVKGVPPSERVKSQYMLFRKYYKVGYTLSIGFPGADIVAEMKYKGKNYGKGKFKFPSPKHGTDAGEFVAQKRKERYEPI